MATVKKLRLLAVFAHPDDEAFGVGGTLAKYAAEGCDVHLVSATRGEAGQILVPDAATKANLPFIREQELRCACDAYGIHPPIFLDYVDGQLTVVHQGQAVGKLVRIIRDIAPDVVLTFGADGIYGHYDHIAIHRWTTIAVNLAADANCFPDMRVEGCQPHRTSKLYYRVLADSEVQGMSDGEKTPSVDMDGVPFYFVGYPPSAITTVIDVAGFRATKVEGIRCHITQVGIQDPSLPDEMMQGDWLDTESYILVQSFVERQNGVETDLFEGLR
jgi:LmbE family N-acetylglucosaminyl deacetylase